MNLFFGYTVVALFMSIGTLIAGLACAFLHIGIGGAPIMQLFWLAFIGLSIYHRREINRKNKAGERWHSMYLGTSILPLPFPRQTPYKFAEPGLVIGAALMLTGISSLPGWWLMIAGASLFIDNHIIYYKQRQAILDIRDAEIEARNMSKAFAGRPAQETNGLLVAESSVELLRTDAGLQEAFRNLSQNWQVCSTLPQIMRSRARGDIRCQPQKNTDDRRKEFPPKHSHKPKPQDGRSQTKE